MHSSVSQYDDEIAHMFIGIMSIENMAEAPAVLVWRDGQIAAAAACKLYAAECSVSLWRQNSNTI